MKRLLSVFLGIALVLGMLAGGLAFADDPVEPIVLDSPIVIAPDEAGENFTITDGSGDQPAATITGDEIERIGVNAGAASMWIDTDETAAQVYYTLTGEPDITVNSDVDGSVSVSSSVSQNAEFGGTAKVNITGNVEIQNSSSNPAVSVYSSAGGVASDDERAVNNSTITVKVDEDVISESKSTDNTSVTAIQVQSYAFKNDENESKMTVTVGGDVVAKAESSGYAGAVAIKTNTDELYPSSQNDSKIKVTVDGSVEATAKTSSENSTSSALAVYTKNATVNIGENVTATGENANATGIETWGNAKVTVGGDVTATSDKAATGIDAKQGSEVTVGGSVESSGRGVYVDRGSTVIIGDDDAATANNLTAGGEAIQVKVETGEGAKQNTVVVDGTVIAGEGKATLALDVGAATDEDVNAVIENLPDIVVQTIASDADFVVVKPQNENNLSGASKTEITNAMFAQISYIVTKNNMDNAKVSLVEYDQGELDKAAGGKYLVAHETDTLTVKNIGGGKILGITFGDGETNQFAAVTPNADGSWTITVRRGGNLAVNVNYEDAKQAEQAEETKQTEQTEQAKQTESSATNITVTPATGEVFTGPTLLTLGSGEKSNVLTVNMVYTNKTDILVSTFQRFADQGYDTVEIVTAGGSYSITMAELLSLADGASLITFVISGDLLEIYVNWQSVMTLALTRTGV